MAYHRRATRVGTLGLAPCVLLIGTGCGEVGPQQRNADAVQLSVQYEIVKNSAGYPLLYATVTARNLGSQPLVGVSGGCVWMFRAYDNPERAGSPVWTEGLRTACTDDQWAVELEPGATQTFPTRGLPFDSIVNGARTYYFAARLRGSVGDERPPGDWLTDWLPAGSLEVVP